MKTIVWFRNDLRLNDNETLNTAIRESECVVPVFVLDERLLQQDRWGFLKTGAYRMKFLLESLEDLKQHLQEKGANLVLKIGKPEEILPELAQRYGCHQIYAAKEYTYEEEQVEQLLAQQISLRFFHTSTLFSPEELPFAIDQLPDVFTTFRKRVEKYAEVPAPLDAPDQIAVPEDIEDTPVPNLQSLGYPILPVSDHVVLPFKGGALSAFNRLDYYLWDKNLLSRYKETRNGMIGGDYSSKFSPWLANGSISARAIYHEVEDYEGEVKKNQSSYWMKFELLWREYFKLVAMRYGRKIFFPGGIQDKGVRWRNDEKRFEKWAMGKTGDDFVDANMRELLFTGFMSNRGRQNVASYLVHQLREDWRKGAAWFESLLIDYDVASNYGNWMYAAGVGNDPRDRVFNMRRQAERYDAKGAYRKLWLEQEDKDPRYYYNCFAASTKEA
jgi:deoxyribodipyrimidine photo-lyase